jgi:D-galactose 1-dehydrogenase
MSIRIAIIGFGKIAQEQHLPAIAANPDFDLVAVSTRSGPIPDGLPCFAQPRELFEGMAGRLDAVAICTPPGVRHAIAREAIAAGLAVLLEKPPAATLGEIEDLERQAREAGTCLYAGWHSQHAPAVAPAARLLKGQEIARLHISWREDVRKYHAGQDWIWEPSGFGVFDPGINALSIATRILPTRLFVEDARLLVPSNKQAPIAATLTFAGGAHTAEFDWRFDDGEEWTIAVETRAGTRVELQEGGGRLLVDGVAQLAEDRGEYSSMYARFAELIAASQVEVDREPLRIVADAFLVAHRQPVEPFA